MVDLAIGFSATLQAQSKYVDFLAANYAQLVVILNQIRNDEKMYGVSINSPAMVNYLAFLMYNAIIPTIEVNYDVTDWLTDDEISLIYYYAKLNNLTAI